MTGEHVKDVDTGAFQREVVDRSQDVPVVVDFWAEWCGPCRILSPLLEKAADDSEGAFELAKVDVDQNQALASQFGVQGIPTVVGFRDGQAVSQFVGAIGESDLQAWLADLVPSEADQAVDRARDLLLAGDEAGAEQIYRDVLTSEPTHQEAGTGLAALLISSDRSPDAVEVLERLDPTPEVDRLMAAARIGSVADADIPEMESALDADPTNHTLRVRLANARAASGEHEQALEDLLRVVKHSPTEREDARRGMLDIFQMLGGDHPLTDRYRRELANALF